MELNRGKMQEAVSVSVTLGSVKVLMAHTEALRSGLTLARPMATSAPHPLLVRENAVDNEKSVGTEASFWTHWILYHVGHRWTSEMMAALL